MAEYVFRDAPGFGCDMDELMDVGGKTVGEYFATQNDDHYGTLHEEIVRCCDCKHMSTVDFSGLYGNHDHDPMFCQLRDNYVDTYDDCFCSWGERKVDE